MRRILDKANCLSPPDVLISVFGLSPGIRYNFWVYATERNYTSEKAHVEGSTIGMVVVDVRIT